jgi:hypothetical protein
MTLNAQKSNMKLTQSKNKNVGLECDICYKKINKRYFQCGSPCSKVFHTDCIEKMMEQIEESANESDDEPNYRCCYCRRGIEINNYLLQLLSQKLIAMHGQSHDIRDALKHVEFKMDRNEYIEDDESLIIYELIDISYIKKPKQPKRQILKKRACVPRKITIKQNIGGRRR